MKDREHPKLHNKAKERLPKIYTIQTFGDPLKDKTLSFIVERINNLKGKKQFKIVQFLQRINLICSRMNNIATVPAHHFLLTLFMEDYDKNFNYLKMNYDPKLVSYLRNFFHTKVKRLMNSSN